MEIHHASHPHKLELKSANRPFYCVGCDQLGFGLSYTCNRSGCNFFLHQQCGKPQSQLVEYPFSNSKKCILKFRSESSGKDYTCDACAKKIKGYHYRCLCKFMKRNLHPFCLDTKQTIEATDGLTLSLKKEATAKCLHCENKNLLSKVHGWAYVSSCNEYCYHVNCVREIINTNWSNGFFTGKSDPFQSIKQAFPTDKDNMHKLVVGKKNEKPTGKKVNAVLSAIFNVFTGNPLGLVGAAQSYFS